MLNEVLKHEDVEKRVNDNIGKYVPFGFDNKCFYKKGDKLYFRRDDGYILLSEKIIRCSEGVPYETKE